MMLNLSYSIYKSIVGVCFIAWGLTGSGIVFAERAGKTIFEQRCVACHNIGGGRLVGPDLAGVNSRRQESWLLKFIKSSQTVIKSGDPEAKALFGEFKIVMPDQTLSDAQIREILAYIKEADTAKSPSAPPGTGATREATSEEILRGQDLFQGKIRFSGGGPSCISCHNVESHAVFGGGILAKELTTVYSRVGAQGIRAILSNAPFPVMNAAFENKPISDEEIHALIGFLKLVDKENTMQQPREYGWVMFGAGSGGVIILFGFYSLLGFRRKRGSVNQDIYDRQVKSQ